MVSNNNTVMESVILIFNQDFNHINYPVKLHNYHAIIEEKKINPLASECTILNTDGEIKLLLDPIFLHTSEEHTTALEENCMQHPQFTTVINIDCDLSMLTMPAAKLQILSACCIKKVV